MTVTSLQMYVKLRGVHMPLQITLLLILCVCFGCKGDPDQINDPKALQDQLKVKIETIGDRDETILDLKQTIEAMEKSLPEQMEAQKKEYEDRIARIRLLHREAVAHLKSRQSELRMELTAVIQEKLVFEELVESEPRIEGAKKKRSHLLVMALLLLTITASAGMVLFANKYKRSREVVNDLGLKNTVRIATMMKEKARLEGKE